MKRLLTITAAICAATLLSAAPVGLQQARKVASLRLGAAESSLTAVLDSRATVSLNSTSDAPYYIFNNPTGGFAIIAGDDCLSPVLGYSLSGRLDPSRMPSNMKYWLGEVSSAVQYIRHNSIKPRLQTLVEWENPVLPETKADEGKLLTLATWYQEAPYNYYCPRIPEDDGQSMTGCVATAIAMIMHYHEWPPCGNGTLPDYEMSYEGNSYSGYYHIPGHALGHEYKWSVMPTADVSTDQASYVPTEGEKQVAWLMYDCGIMMQALYSYDGTGAYSQYIPSRLHKYMYYKKASYVSKDTYTGDWITLIKDQIDRGLPVIYGADDPTQGGHQFVVCGYDPANRLYVNWGWGGSGNGYYALSSFIPKEMGLRFTQNHDAIVNLEPDRSYTPVPEYQEEPMAIVPAKSDGPEEPATDTPSTLYLKGDYYNDDVYLGVYLSEGNITRGATFKMDAGVLFNPTSSRYTGYFRFDQCSYEGSFIGTLGTYKKSGKVSTMYINSKKTYYVAPTSCTASFDIALGDKIILSTSTSNASGSWTQVPWVDDIYTIGEYPMIPMNFINPVTHDSIVNGVKDYIECEILPAEGSVRAELEMEDGSTEIILLEL